MCKMNIAARDKVTSPHRSTLRCWPLIFTYLISPCVEATTEQYGRNSSAFPLDRIHHMRHNSTYIVNAVEIGWQNRNSPLRKHWS